MTFRLIASLASSLLLCAPSTAQKAQAYYRMKLVKTIDQHGFDRPIPSASMLIPSDWQFSGQTSWVRGNSCDPVQTTFKVSSPDGKLAIEGFPQYDWQWNDDPAMRQAAAADLQTRARYGSKGCDLQPPQSAADFLRANYRKVRPNGQVAAVEPIADVAEQAARAARQGEAEASRYGLRQRIRTDAARLRLAYSANGQPVEEWVTALIVVRATAGPSYNLAMGRMAQTTYYNCSATMLFALRAPRGQLQASEKLFRMLLSTIRVNPDWQARVSGTMTNVAAAEQKGARERSAIAAKNNAEVSKIITDGWQQRQKVQDETAANFSQMTRGVETYRNPSTGETIDLDNRYGRAWASASGEYLLSDDPNFDPNVVLREKWTALQQVK